MSKITNSKSEFSYAESLLNRIDEIYYVDKVVSQKKF